MEETLSCFGLDRRAERTQLGGATGMRRYLLATREV